MSCTGLTYKPRAKRRTRFSCTMGSAPLRLCQLEHSIRLYTERRLLVLSASTTPRGAAHFAHDKGSHYKNKRFLKRFCVVFSSITNVLHWILKFNSLFQDLISNRPMHLWRPVERLRINWTAYPNSNAFHMGNHWRIWELVLQRLQQRKSRIYLLREKYIYVANFTEISRTSSTFVRP